MTEQRPSAPPTGYSSCRISTSGGPRARAVPPRARRQPSLPVARRCRRGRARPTATTSSTRPSLSDELGGEEEFRALCEAGLGVILDIVPNHMAASEDENPFWRDPLHARSSSTSNGAAGASAASSTSATSPASGSKTRRCSGDAREGDRARARRRRRRRPGRPSRRARKPGALPRAAARGGHRARLGREDPRAGERLRDWPVKGRRATNSRTTSRRLFVDPAAEEPLTSSTLSSPARRRFEEIAYEAKLEQALTTFEPEVDWLRAELGDAGRPRPAARARLVPRLPHLRRPRHRRGRRARPQAIAEAQLPARARGALCSRSAAHDAFVIRFQQTTPPDGEGSRGHRVLPLQPASLPERGRRRPGAVLALGRRLPRRTSSAQDGFRANCWPRRRTTPSGAATSAPPHRALLARRGVARARRSGATERARSRGAAPDGNEEYFVYQTLIGAWRRSQPERLDDYLERRCARQRRTRTGSTPTRSGRRASRPSRALVAHSRSANIRAVHRTARGARRADRLAQTLLKLTCPGVPDIYQGDELWSLNLVDPDNRRPVDWERRRNSSPSCAPASRRPARRRSSI